MPYLSEPIIFLLVYNIILQKANSKKDIILTFFKKLKLLKSKELDPLFHEAHHEAFKKIDCLMCANCCKTTSPIILQEDITRISKYLETNSGNFIKEFVEMDEDGDFVFKQTPCVFLGSDNACKIYDVRPKACSEYPHTNRKRMKEILDITYHNTFICPAVALVVEKLERENLE